MLKKFTWIAAALLAMLAMAFFGCTDAGSLDDGSAPVADKDLVLEGDDIVLKACGAQQAKVVINGNKVTLDGNNTGFYFDFPEEAADYVQVQVFFKIAEMIDGKPGLLIKRSTKFDNPVGILSDEDPAYQLNDAATSGKEGYPIKPGFSFTVGMEFDTGKWKTNQFDNQMAFQNQVYNPEGNSNAKWTVEVLKIVFPGATDAEIVFNADGGEEVKSIVVQQGEEIGDLPVTTKDGAVFTGWYTTTTPVTEVLSDYVVPLVKTLTLKAGWATAGVTVTKNSLINAYPAFSDPGSNITVNPNGSATFAVDTAGWPAVKYVYPAQVTTANTTAPYTYNVVELTLNASEDFDIQVKDQNKDKDINKYPTGDQVVSLKKGVNKFSVALSDSGAAGLSIQNRSNANEGGAVITIVSAIFTKGDLYTVTFDGKAQVKATNVPDQKVIANRKATAPGAQNWYDVNFVKATDFIGWYDGDKLFDFATMVITKDTDLVSKWAVAYKRTVTFDLTGLEIDEDPFAEVQEKTIALGTLPVVNPLTSTITLPTITDGIPEDYALGGWFDVSVTPFVRYHDGTSWLIPDITKDITLKALFSTSFDVDLGTGTESTVDNTGASSSAFSAFATDAFASGTLTLTFSGSGNEIAFIPLTTAQVALVKNAMFITIKVTVAGTAPSGNFRYGLADKTLGGSWNGTAVSWAALTSSSVNTLNPDFANLSSGKPGPVSSFFIQGQGVTGSLNITKIEISLVQ